MTVKSLFSRCKGFWPRRGLSVLLVALVGTLMVCSVLWWLVARQIQTAALEWLDQRQQAGDVITYQALTVTGFPWRWQLQLKNPSWQRQSGFGQQLLASPEIQIVTALTHFGRLKLAAPADFTVAQKAFGVAGQLSGVLSELQLTVDQMGAISAGNLRVRTLQAEFAGEAARVQQLDFSWQVDHAPDGPTQALRFDLRGTHLPQKLLLGGMADGHLVVDAEIIGDIGTGQAVDMTLWRDNGGLIQVKTLQADFAPLRLTGDATVTLDQDLQLTAASTFEVEGVDLVIKTAAQKGYLTPRARLIAEILIGSLSQRKQGQDAGTIELPLSLQAGQLWLGPLAIARVPRLPWQTP